MASSGNFNVKHGGKIRFSAIVSSSESNAWNKGRLLKLNTDGTWAIHDGTNRALTGVAMEDRILSTSVGPTTSLTKVGAPTGARYSAILDPAVVTTDEITSGISFNPGDDIYVSTGGAATTSGNSTGSNAHRIGKAISSAHSNDNLRPLTFYFDVSY